MAQKEKQTRAGPAIGLILLVILIVVPLAEIAVLIQVGGLIGLWPTLLLIVLTAIIGSMMLRQQGFALLGRARRQLDAGQPPIREVFEGLCLLVAGALLLTPGFLTDAGGALLLLPPVRHGLYRALRTRMAGLAAGAAAGARPGDGAAKGPDKGAVSDAEFEELDPAQDQPAPPSADGNAPPPRGGWDKRE